MQAEQVRQLTDDAITRLTQALDAGKSDTLVRFLAAMAKFHRYSWGNVLLIMFQRPDAGHVAGFNTWKSLGRFVRKGEKGIVIMAPMMIKPREEFAREAREQGEEPRPVLRFRGVYVFDITQTDGEPLPDAAHVQGDPGQCLDRLRAFVEGRGITLVYDVLPLGVSGASSGGRITLHRGLPPAEEFSVLVHELAHEILHHGEGAQRGTKSSRETEAEAVAFIVSEAVGLSTGTASSDYIQLYNGDRDTLTASLDRIQKTAAEILAAFTVEPAPQPGS